MNVAPIKLIEKEDVEQFPCKGLELQEVFVVEGSTRSGLPTVIFRFKHQHEYFEFETTGRIVNGISAIVKGSNLRKFGAEEP
jgi:hypothetical protein